MSLQGRINVELSGILYLAYDLNFTLTQFCYSRSNYINPNINNTTVTMKITFTVKQQW